MKFVSLRIIKKEHSDAPGADTVYIATLVQRASTIESCRQFATKKYLLVLQGQNEDN